jgi:ribose transport system substrate-binding protein
MWRKYWIAILLIVGLAAGASCNRSSRKRIGVVPKAVAHVFWQSVHAGAVAAGREGGVEIEWKGPPQETDFSRQIEIVDSMINARVDGIVLAPTEATSLVSVVERAAAQNIPLTIFDSGINTEQYVSYVSTNNYEAGVLAARKLGAILNGKGKIAMVKMVPGSSSTMERERGFEETLAKEFPDLVKVGEQYCMSDRARALTVTENMLTANPDLDALFASAEPATVGAAQALKARELSGKVKFVGFDSSDTIEQDLKAGVIDALVVQDPFNIGYAAVKTILAKLNGEAPPKRIDSPAHVVTVVDLADPKIDKVLHPDLKQYLE